MNEWLSEEMRVLNPVIPATFMAMPDMGAAQIIPGGMSTEDAHRIPCSLVYSKDIIPFYFYGKASAYVYH